MKRRPVTLLLGCLCLALLTGAYLTLKRSNDQAEQEAAEQSDTEPILTISPDEVRQISFLIDGSNTAFSRTDTDDDWHLSEDQNFPVDPAPISDILEQLAPLGAVRTLTDAAALSEYGLDTPSNTVTVTTQDGTETTIALGDTNNSTGDDYVMLNGDSSTLYTIGSSLRSCLLDRLYDYAAGEELPMLLASDITGVDVSLDSQELALSLKDNLWTVSDGNADLENVDQEAVSSHISDLTGLSYVDFLDYNCTTPEQYGLNPPAATITISWKDDSSDGSGEADSSDETETDTAETELTEAGTEEQEPSETGADTGETELTEAGTEEQEPSETGADTAETELTEAGTEETSSVQQLTLHVGATDDSGNYYVQLEGSTEIHTMSADFIEGILGWTAADFEAEPESESETETGTGVNSQAEAETDASPQTETETDVNSQTEAETDVNSQTEVETETDF